MATTNPENDGPTLDQLLEAIRTLTRTIRSAAERVSTPSPPAPPSDVSRPKDPPTVKVPEWERPSGPRQSAWKWIRRAAARVRMAGGEKAGVAARAGLQSAGKALQTGWPVNMALRSGLASAAGALGPWTLAIGAAVGSALKFAEAMDRNVKAQLDYSKHLAESSAMMRAVMARRDLQERLRDREKGDRLSTSANMLAQSEQFSKDTTKEIDIAINRVKNMVGTAWNIAKASFFWRFELIAGVFNKISDFIDKVSGADQAKPLTMDQWAKEIMQHDNNQRKHKSPQWEPPRYR